MFEAYKSEMEKYLDAVCTGEEGEGRGTKAKTKAKKKKKKAPLVKVVGSMRSKFEEEAESGNNNNNKEANGPRRKASETVGKIDREVFVQKGLCARKTASVRS